MYAVFLQFTYPWKGNQIHQGGHCLSLMITVPDFLQEG